MKELCSRLEEINDRITTLRTTICYRAAAKLAVDIILKKQENRLDELGSLLNEHAVGLAEIGRLYTACEKEIAGYMTGG